MAACWTAWCASRAARRSTTPADAIVSARRWSTSRRLISDIAFPHFFGQVLRRSPRERNDRVGRILVAMAHERPAVGDEEVADVVRLAELVEHARARIVAHSHAADFVDDAAAGAHRRRRVVR